MSHVLCGVHCKVDETGRLLFPFFFFLVKNLGLAILEFSSHNYLELC